MLLNATTTKPHNCTLHGAHNVMRLGSQILAITT